MTGQRFGRDPLAELATDPATAEILAAARAEIDALLWRRDVRSNAVEVAASSMERGARDSAAIDGADLAVVDDSPMGMVLDAAIRLTAAVTAISLNGWRTVVSR
jgi:hypothetical protein